MVTCKVIDSQSVAAITKMNSVRARKPASSNSSGFRLLDGDQLESSTSSVSRNSVYKLKIDLMFDDTRSIRSNHLDDLRGSQRTRSIIMYGRSELASSAGAGESSAKSIAKLLQHEATSATTATTTTTATVGIGATRHLLADATQHDVQRISNTVQAQIEQLFTDVAKDATSSFAVTCLGALPLKDKVTSLQGLQEPLRDLYVKEMTSEVSNSGFLDICTSGLRVKLNSSGSVSSSAAGIVEAEGNITPFHHIAVWSAVKFVVSVEDGGAAFLPLITDPDNIDKASLFQPLSAVEQRHVVHNTHAPIFAVVMRSATMPKVLECHGFICKSTEDAIVIAATLYQSLMAHVSSGTHRSTKRRTPRNQNGVSCVSIASSSAQTGSNYLSHSQIVSSGRKSSFRSSTGSHAGGASSSTRSARKKRVGSGSASSLNNSANVINETAETTTEERKRKSHKTKRAPPVPTTSAYGGGSGAGGAYKALPTSSNAAGYLEALAACSHSQRGSLAYNGKHSQRGGKGLPLGVAKSVDSIYRAAELLERGAAEANGGNAGALRSSDTTGDILTRVAIPRSGSFLNTGGLTRYKSRAARRHSGKLGSGCGGGGGGGGSPLGFSELFNEFRLHENLHSLDDILYAIIDADGMSFNDLKPIYKEFLLKLAVTLTKDELFQRSKNIMRRQKKKKKLKRKTSSVGSQQQKKPKGLIFGAKNLKKVFQLGQFRSCRGKPPKPPRTKDAADQLAALSSKRKLAQPLTIGPPCSIGVKSSLHHHQQSHRNRVATSGSDVSLVRPDHGFPGLNRNSSSGYVSCSECSYDSEACTCASADRCYCSLRTDHASNGKHQHNHNSKQLLRKNERNASTGALAKHMKNRGAAMALPPAGNHNRSSLISCKSEDKCYCSMVEEEEQHRHDDDVNTHSDTTWCDTDSCVSASKCYCKRSERRNARQAAAARAAESEEYAQRRRSRPSASRSKQQPAGAEKLAFDYELFTINGNSKSVQPHEALSVKKSVEAAAIFADVKLSQTTDITSLCPTQNAAGVTGNRRGTPAGTRNQGSMRSQSSSTRRHRNEAGSHSKRRVDSVSIDRKLERQAQQQLVALSNASQKSCSADDLLSKLSAIEKAVMNHAASVKSATSSHRSRATLTKEATLKSSYQSMRAVSASLEDSLGYLP